MRKSYLLYATATAMLVGASAASAGNVDISAVAVDPDNPYNTVDLSGNIGVGGTYTHSPYSSNNQISGLILLTTKGGQTLPVFCVDLFHDIGIGSYNPALPYFTTPVTTDSADGQPGEGNSISTMTAEEMQTLVNIGYGGYKNHTLTGDEATALQDAIWTIEYNGTYNGVTSDLTVTANGADGSIIDGLAAGYVTYADKNPASYSLGLFPGSTGQGFGGSGQGFVAGAPEPSTYAMMLLGFAGLGFAGYRKARAKPAFA